MARPLRLNATQVPDVILDRWMAELSGAEFKVLMYIVRRTYGFQKEGDSISLSQIVGGIVKRDGTRLDSGTGLSKDTVCTALSSLQKKGIVIRELRHNETSQLPNFYTLNLEASGMKGPEGQSENPTRQGGKITGGIVRKSNRRERANSDNPRSENPTQQQTGLQQTDLQETATTAADLVSDAEPSDVVVASFNSESEPEDRGAVLLRAEGFSKEDASLLASKAPLETIQLQITWLPLRKASANRLGLLRRAIEGNWSEPSPKEPKGKQGATSLHETSKSEANDVRNESLKLTYRQLQVESPEAFNDFLAFVEHEKERLRSRPLIADNPRRLATVLDSFDTEEGRLELMQSFLRLRATGSLDLRNAQSKH